MCDGGFVSRGGDVDVSIGVGADSLGARTETEGVFGVSCTQARQVDVVK